MTHPDRWTRVESIYHAAAALPPPQRTAYLARVCGDDLELRREIESLLAQGSGERLPGASDFAAVAGAIASAPELKLGDRVGSYEITGRLGAGGMGVVYRARDPHLGRNVALKMLPPDVAHDPNRVARFLREARMLAALNHPHIAQVYGFDDPAQPTAIVMELVEGETLADRIGGGPVPVRQALEVARQIADALAAAHERGIIHRDLKPANIKVRPDGTVKVLDFGLGKVVESASADADGSPTISADATERGLILGTAAYMSPEQASGKSVDRRTDLWSFGVVLMEMLSGRRVFEGETASHVIASVLNTEPDWSALPAATPPAIHTLLRRCLEKNPQRRLDSATAARFALDDAGSDRHDGMTQPGRGLSWPVTAAIAAVGVVAAGSLGYRLLSPPRAAEPVRRLTVSFPPGEEFVDTPGNALLFVPDGSAFVYSGRGAAAGNQLYYRRLDQQSGVRLPGTDGACCPAISPSGEWVAFVVGNKEIRKVSTRGDAAPIGLGTTTYSGGLAWGFDDYIYAAEEGDGLRRIAASGGIPAERVARPNQHSGERAWFLPAALADGTILVQASMVSGGTKIVAIGHDGSSQELEGDDGQNPIGLANSRLLYGRSSGGLGLVSYSASRPSLEPSLSAPDVPIWRPSGVLASMSRHGDLLYARREPLPAEIVADDGHVIAQISSPSLENPSVAPDGRYVAFTARSQGRYDIWLYDVAGQFLRRLTTDEDAHWPSWSSDGRQVLFVTWRGGLREVGSTRDVWVVSVDRSAAPARLFTSTLGVTRASLSPDGRYLVFSANSANTGFDIYVADLRDGGRVYPLETSRFNEASPAVSPDGRWLAYASDESGKSQVYVRPFPGEGPHVQVSADGGSQPRWTGDSNKLLYVYSRSVIRATIDPRHSAIERQVVVSPARAEFDEFDAFRDGRVVVTRSGPTAVVLVTNWLSELTRGSSAAR